MPVKIWTFDLGLLSKSRFPPVPPCAFSLSDHFVPQEVCILCVHDISNISPIYPIHPRYIQYIQYLVSLMCAIVHYFELFHSISFYFALFRNIWARFGTTAGSPRNTYQVGKLTKIALGVGSGTLSILPKLYQKYSKILNIYLNISDMYKGIPRHTKYQAAAGPPRRGASGPCRAGRPRRHLVFCIFCI